MILKRIKKLVHSANPDATVILFGSYSRGDESQNSDLDILILLNKKNITRDEETRITYPLYDLEFETGKIISPIVLSKTKWKNRHKITPFYENVLQEGTVL